MSERFVMAIDDSARDRIVTRLRKHERRQLHNASLRDAPEMERLRELARRGEAEVRRHGALERRRRPAAVLAPRSHGDGLEPDVVAATPVAGDRAEREEARVTPVR